MRTRTIGRALAVALLALLIYGCDFEDIFTLGFYYFDSEPVSGSQPGRGVVVPALPQGTEALLGAALQRASDYFVEAGTFEINGSLTPETPPATLPPTLRMIARQKSSTNVLKRTLNFDLAVQSSGAILTQTFPIGGTFVDVGDRWELSIEPLGADLPPADLALRVRYRKT